MLIGFIGQGFIGKAYADDVEERGYDVIRYSADPEHAAAKERLRDCDVVFIAVPTPTTPSGFDDTILREVVGLVGEGKIAVIKSTLLPGRTRAIQALHPTTIVLHAPEFLVAKNAREDAKKPLRNIIGMPDDTEKYRDAARTVLSVLPKAPYELVCSAEEAELVKYVGNNLLASKVILANVFHDIAMAHQASWGVIAEAVGHDPRIGPSHLAIEDAGGRGAGGYCFIKDLAAIREEYDRAVGDADGGAVLRALERKNAALLSRSGKDLDLLRGVYGEGMQPPARDR
jgi:UDP-glucose 6-dehydrogenase